MNRYVGTRRAAPLFLRLLLLLAALVVPSGRSAAQEELGLPRSHAGLALAIGVPLGEFDDYVDVGGGVDGFFRVRLDPDGIISLRVHGGFINYANETKRVCLSETIGCRIQVDLTTSNNILLFGVGPELAAPMGRVRVYVNGSIGFDYFSTDSNVAGTETEVPFASTRNFGDGGFSWNSGGGVEVRVGHISNLPFAIDVGAAYQGNGRREYLTRGGIVDLPDGSLRFDVKRSDADLLLFRVGVTLGIRSQPDDDGNP